jgi:tRNA-dihydrouridine synthase
MLTFYGTDLGHRVARKHLGWYLEEAGQAARWRAPMMRATDPAAVFAMI